MLMMRNFSVLRNEVLVRFARDRIRPAGLEITQILVPIVLRNKLLGLSHDLPSSAHLGVQKTKDRLYRHFFWPNLDKYVRDYIRTCSTCQRVDKSGHQFSPSH